jgi:hypothetical protein
MLTPVLIIERLVSAANTALGMGKKHPKSSRFSTLFKGLARDPKIPSCIY